MFCFFFSEIGRSLFLAVLCGHANVVDILLKGGASVNQAGPANETSVFQASANGMTDIVEMLCQAGADVNLCNSEGTVKLYKVQSLVTLSFSYCSIALQMEHSFSFLQFYMKVTSH